MSEINIIQELIATLGSGGLVIWVCYILTNRMLTQISEQTTKNDEDRKAERQTAERVVERLTLTFTENQAADRDLREVERRLLLKAIEGVDGGVQHLTGQVSAINDTVCQIRDTQATL